MPKWQRTDGQQQQNKKYGDRTTNVQTHNLTAEDDDTDESEAAGLFRCFFFVRARPFAALFYANILLFNQSFGKIRNAFTRAVSAGARPCDGRLWT